MEPTKNMAKVGEGELMVSIFSSPCILCLQKDTANVHWDTMLMIWLDTCASRLEQEFTLLHPVTEHVCYISGV